MMIQYDYAKSANDDPSESLMIEYVNGQVENLPTHSNITDDDNIDWLYIYLQRLYFFLPKASVCTSKYCIIDGTFLNKLDYLNFNYSTP